MQKSAAKTASLPIMKSAAKTASSFHIYIYTYIFSWVFTSHVPEVCLMIFESLGAVCLVESVRHPCQKFVDDL